VAAGADVVRGDDGVRRCVWGASSPDYAAYHDDEWGRPVVDDTRLYEKLCLEGFQSGLSWLTILRKRENFRAAFAGFDIPVVAEFGTRDVRRLLGDAGIVRHRGKIEAAISNARAALEAKEHHGSLAALFWSFEPRGRRPAPRAMSDLAPKTAESEALSKTLRALGFRYVGPTTVHAAMQSLGVVNDHFVGCSARAACRDDRAAPQRPPQGWLPRRA
jgi:DNA-3-methyladenine glycosylase I